MCCQLMSDSSTDMQELVGKVEERMVGSKNTYKEDISNHSFNFSKGSNVSLDFDGERLRALHRPRKDRVTRFSKQKHIQSLGAWLC